MTFLDDLKTQYKTGDISQKLLYWNIALFVISEVAKAVVSLFGVDFGYQNFISLSSNPMLLLQKPWSILSYAFFHANFLHLFFNMMVLQFSSRLFLTFFRPNQLLQLYLLGSVFAAFVYLLCSFLTPNLSQINSSLVGASGAIMAILFAVATYSPHYAIRLMLVGNIKLWHLALTLILIDLIQLPIENTGGHLAHLGGAIFGFLYCKTMQQGTDLGKWMTTVTTFFGPSKPKTPFKKIYKNPTINPTKTASKIVLKDKQQQQIDDILDKISQSGYDSLTKQEKETLFSAGK